MTIVQLFDYIYTEIKKLMKNTTLKTNERGFTLIELLVVIGILAILLAITLIAINPARQFAQARNTERRSAITQILNAVGGYFADHGGNLPTGLSGQAAGTYTALNDTNYPSLCTEIVNEYIPALPVDPSNGAGDVDTCAAGWVTDYEIMRDANNRITISAPSAENGETITVTR